MRFVCVVSMSQKFRLHYNPLFNSWIAIKVKKKEKTTTKKNSSGSEDISPTHLPVKPFVYRVQPIPKLRVKRKRY